ncbi:MAG TPA: prolyl oligopeptidase family serine peptidase [Streptosporangiaceae bacterium]|nr:prolyl oligopeptidase family serine peptidase [Streptosporangiaceae bacterium]
MRHGTAARPTGSAVPRPTEVVEFLGPHQVSDPYRWLEDPGDPRTISWLGTQQALFRQAQARWPGRRQFLRRMEELTAFEECSSPVWRDHRAFYSCRGPDDEHPSLRTARYSRDGTQADSERVILDPVRLDPTGRTTLDSWVPSPDGRLVACQISVDGTEQPALRILDVASGVFTDSAITGCRISPVAWLADSAAFYYVADTPTGAGPRVWWHEVGTPADQDLEVFGAGLGEISELDIVLDPAGQRLLVTVTTDLAATTDIWLVDHPAGRAALTGYKIAACPDGWTSAWPGDDGLLYLLTDDEAPRGRIVVADAATAQTDQGRTLVGEEDAEVVESLAILAGPALPRPVLVVARSQAGHARLSRHDLSTGRWLSDIPLPGTGNVTDLSVRPGGGHELWFGYADTTTPPTVYRYDAASGSVTPWRPAPVFSAGGSGPTGATATELRYPSADGTQVRLLLTRPTEVTGPRPTILHAYGAFGESHLAEYYELGLAWAQAGGVFAIACVRGGGDEGEDWHEAGMLENKQRSIDDLVAAAEYLIAAGVAEPCSVGVKGFSAGGLLAAAAFVQRPDLFAAAECTSPLTDMARYELSGLGRYWSGEFGTRDDPAELGWMLSYSPYHNVTDGTSYPPVLLATFDGDTRVDPMHARKFCAALQDATCSGHPVLLRTEPGVGHGERSRAARLRYFADVLAFFDYYLSRRDDHQPAQERPARKEVN